MIKLSHRSSGIYLKKSPVVGFHDLIDNNFLSIIEFGNAIKDGNHLMSSPNQAPEVSDESPKVRVLALSWWNTTTLLLALSGQFLSSKGSVVDSRDENVLLVICNS